MKIRSTAVRTMRPFDPDFCPRFFKLQYVDGNDYTKTSFKKGHMFEQELLGCTANCIVVEPEYLKDGVTPTKEFRDIQELAEWARELMLLMGIENLEIQKYIETDDSYATIDLVALYKGVKSIIDIKYTETKEDERWNEHGWGDIDNKDLFQAAHYVKLWHELYGEWLPFYYLIFGKSGWVKFISVKFTKDYFNVAYPQRKQAYLHAIENYNRTGWPANPSFNRCRKCELSHLCDQKAILPTVETITLDAQY